MGADADPRRQPGFFVSADWSKNSNKRAVHVADVTNRRIWWEDRPDWTLESLLDFSRGLRSGGPVLVGLDMVFGLPAGYWAEALKVARWRESSSFLDWLGRLDPASSVFKRAWSAEDWSVNRPFFNVPKGKGGLHSVTSQVPGGMLRPIDKATGAKPMFAVSGIPGTVGSGTRDLWMELIPLLKEDRDFAVWPFEGELETLLERRSIVLAESYPGLAYAVALADSLPTNRLVVAKTRREPREKACDLLERAEWVGRAGVELGDLGPVRADEDPFDSHFMAAAALRCLVEGRPLCDPNWVDATAEGGMLLAGPVDVERRATMFMVGSSPKKKSAPSGAKARSRPKEAQV